MEILSRFRKCTLTTNTIERIDRTLEFFSFLRFYSLRRPALVLPLVPVLRDTQVDTIEYWQAVELAAFAAADVSNYSLFNWCCDKIKKRFGDNWRLNRLVGLFHEIRLDYKAAAAVYERSLAKHPSCPELYKRQVAILKSLNAYEQAAVVLCDYLKTFMVDEESWCELVYIYLHLRKYEEAAFAASELIILNPSNWFYFLLFAEIHYNIGSYESLVTARKYCCYVCKIQRSCPRVLYDLLLVCKALATFSQASKNMNERLYLFASKHLRQLYKNSCFLFAVEELVACSSSKKFKH
ncbi:hypothetical protein GpartN1_g6216.t1 [Galdieria partita]|uniref:ER membrane protein complex subunit 2 n=1 Tax=Galdieria partita TaxID=83374 RepID=A0A9C7UTF8_9RHOD|nr:hypothetical protein GpartN1_g6216.t1 [Galdieria partita]